MYKEMVNLIEITTTVQGKFKYGLGVDEIEKGYIGHACGTKAEDVEKYESFLDELMNILQES